jgi:hypothetical protein
MSEIVLRVRLVGGGQLDVVYQNAQIDDQAALIEEVVTSLTQPSGALRTRHGDRLMMLFGRGVAAIEFAPRGAVV